jgi:hypothetical protein
MLDRGSLIKMLLAYAGLTVVVVAVSRGHALLAGAPEVRDDEVEQGSPALAALAGSIAPGVTVGRWVVHEVGPVRRGTLRVELRAAGERVALTLARPDEAGPRPLAGTEALALYPAVHDLSAYTPTAAAQEAATALAVALDGRAAPPDLLPLH